MRIPTLKRSLKHARLISPQPENIVFRCGPCDICGGACLCRPDSELVDRLLTGLKPVGTFCYETAEQADREVAKLQGRGLTCWRGQNKWGMHEVVATLNPDVDVRGFGTPRDVAMTQTFINEELPQDVTGAMYGYT